MGTNVHGRLDGLIIRPADKGYGILGYSLRTNGEQELGLALQLLELLESVD